jgi:hypothetical protein
MARRDTSLVHRGEIAGLVGDHGALTGLTDDDHSIYHTDARALTWLQAQNVSELTNDAGYLTTIAGLAVTTLDGTAYRGLIVNATGDVAEVAHGTSGYVWTSNGAAADPTWQAAAGGGPTNWVDNGLAGDGLYNSNIVLKTTNAGADIFSGAGAGNNGILNLYDGGGTHRFDILKSDSDGNTYLTNREASGDILIRVRDPADSANDTGINIVSGGAVNLHYDGTASVATSSAGMVAAGASTTSAYYLADSIGGTTLGSFQHNGTILRTYGNEHGTAYHIVLEDAVGSAKTVASFDPDDAVVLQFDGTDVFSTTAAGCDFSTNLSLVDIISTGASNSAFLGLRGATNGGVRLYWDEANSRFTAAITNASGGSTIESIMQRDLNGELRLYHDNDPMIVTTATGVQVDSSTANNARIVLRDSTDAEVAMMHVNSAALRVKSFTHSHLLNLVAEDSVGTSLRMFTGDPDVGVAFNGSAAVAAPTYTVTNDLTDRTYNANSTTLAELADVVGTIIADLQANGLFA